MISGIARDLGPSAYAVPRAGTTAAGVAGYRGLACELLEQMPSGAFDVVVAVGSGGMCAGLLLGFEEAAGPAGDGDGIRVVGVPAGKTPQEAVQAVRGLARLVRDQRLSRADPDSALQRLRVRGQAGARSPAADRIAASCGVLLDPVFAGPAWHTACAGPPGPGWPGSGWPVVLVASGGLPAYFDALAASR
jgi:1-aminocyclopropane-1-carboxylate deaminase/D-cysteine desulfhydrase-like pyridoxal-dependent ACC family enzyme